LTPPKAEYIGADQLPSSSFRLQLGGGPYIPKSRLVETWLCHYTCSSQQL
jgi:hypothetical protein